VCFKRFQGRPGVFPTDPVPLIFAFLTRQGVQLAQPVITLLIFSPLLLCGSAAGRLHAGERQEIVKLTSRLSFATFCRETASLLAVSGTCCFSSVASSKRR
jgi:hypothetical protein